MAGQLSWRWKIGIPISGSSTVCRLPWLLRYTVQKDLL